MVPREGDNMGGPPGTPNGYEMTMPKGVLQDNIETTDKPMHMCGTKNNKEANKRPDRGRKHHGSINPYGEISRIFYHQYTSTSKRKELYPRQKRTYAILIIESRGRLQVR